MKDKFLLIHMDDIGMNYACNEAARDLFQKGIVTSASVMMPCAWAYEFIQWCKEHPGYDVGIHATLTCEWEPYRWRPLLDRKEVPGLYDGDGFMHQSNQGVLDRATAEEIEKEVEMQIRQALQWGLRPTHLDRHMYTICMCPEYFEKYVLLAKEYGIPYQMNVREYDSIDQIAARFPCRKFDGRVSSGTGTELASRKASLMQALEEMKPGIYQLTIHPVIPTPEISRIIPGWEERVMEYRLFMDDEIRECMDRLDIKRVSWKEIL